MSGTTLPKAAPVTTDQLTIARSQLSVAQSQLATARSEARSQIATARSEGQASGEAEGIKEGMTAERARIRAILGSDEAKRKGAFANHLALETELTVDAVKGILASSPAEAAPAAVNYLAAFMAQVKNPEIGVGAETGGHTEEQAAAAMAASIVQAYRAGPSPIKT